jgi:hypothetical protein
MSNGEYMSDLAKALDEMPREEIPYSRNVLLLVRISDGELRKIAAELRRRARAEVVET